MSPAPIYPVMLFDIILGCALALLLAIQLAQALLLFRLRGELSRSTPVELARQVSEMRTDLSILTSVFDPQFLVRLRQNDARQQSAIDGVQREVNAHREILVTHARRLDAIQGNREG